MSLLTKCESSRWSDFLNIEDNQVPNATSADQDFFIGKNKSITLTITSGTTVKVRDVVVLGELIIKSSSSEKATFVARDFFAPGQLNISDMQIKCRNFYQPESVKKFFEELRSLISSVEK